MLSETFGGGARSDELEAYYYASSGEAAILPGKRKRPGRIISSVRACINVSRSSRAASLAAEAQKHQGQPRLATDAR